MEAGRLKERSPRDAIITCAEASRDDRNSGVTPTHQESVAMVAIDSNDPREPTTTIEVECQDVQNSGM